MHNRALEWRRQHRQGVLSEKLTCELQRYSVHKHFYGERRMKFRKIRILAGKMSGFYTIVSITVPNRQHSLVFDDPSDSDSIQKE